MIHLHQIDPIAFSLGPVRVHWYGLMYLLAFASAWWLGNRRIRAGRLPVDANAFGDLLFYGMLGVVLGGRLGSILFYDLDGYLADPLRMLRRVGLGYLKLGQDTTTLSGGEAQRLKLSRELLRRGEGRTLYLIDEPTTGLHFSDVQVLLDVVHDLVDLGNTVVVIEHSVEFAAACDWIVDLGPGGGEDGGEVVTAGPPEEVAVHPESAIAPYLERHLRQVARHTA